MLQRLYIAQLFSPFSPFCCFRNLNKKSNVEKEEARLLLEVICSTNIPKFVTEDIPLFEQILVDLFPGLTAPSSEDKFLQVISNVLFSSYVACDV